MVSRAGDPKTLDMKDPARARVRLEPGTLIDPLVLRSIDGGTVSLPAAAGTLVHLQFRRYAGCPICSLHLQSFARRHDELVRAGIREVAVFHSTEVELRQVHRLPFAVVADPEKRLYAQFGVGTSPAAVLDPRVWPTAMRAVAVELPVRLRAMRSAGRQACPRRPARGRRRALSVSEELPGSAARCP